MDVFFALPNFRGAGLPKVIPILSPAPTGTSPGKKFCEDTPTSLEVIGAHTLNFKQKFKFSRLNFLGGAPSQLWFVLASLGQSVGHVRGQHNTEGQHPPRAEI